jgi:hypothetical protein
MQMQVNRDRAGYGFYKQYQRLSSQFHFRSFFASVARDLYCGQ